MVWSLLLALLLPVAGAQDAESTGAEPETTGSEATDDTPAVLPDSTIPIDEARPERPDAPAVTPELLPGGNTPAPPPPPLWRVSPGAGRVTVLLTTRGYLAPLAHHHVVIFPAVSGGGSLQEADCAFTVEVDTSLMRVDDTDDRERLGLPGTIGSRQRRRVERRVRDVVLRASDHGPIRFTATRCHDAMGTFDGALTITDQSSPISGRATLTAAPHPRLVATTSVRLDTYQLPSASRWLGLILPERVLPVVIELPLTEG